MSFSLPSNGCFSVPDVRFASNLVVFHCRHTFHEDCLPVSVVSICLRIWGVCVCGVGGGEGAYMQHGGEGEISSILLFKMFFCASSKNICILYLVDYNTKANL